MTKPTLPEVLPRFKAYVARPGNGAGGSLHIILADGNDRDGHVQFCLEWAQQHKDVEGAELAQILLVMSRTQRRKLASVVWH